MARFDKRVKRDACQQRPLAPMAIGQRAVYAVSEAGQGQVGQREYAAGLPVSDLKGLTINGSAMKSHTGWRNTTTEARQQCQARSRNAAYQVQFSGLI